MPELERVRVVCGLKASAGEPRCTHLFTHKELRHRAASPSWEPVESQSCKWRRVSALTASPPATQAQARQLHHSSLRMQKGEGETLFLCTSLRLRCAHSAQGMSTILLSSFVSSGVYVCACVVLLTSYASKPEGGSYRYQPLSFCVCVFVCLRGGGVDVNSQRRWEAHETRLHAATHTHSHTSTNTSTDAYINARARRGEKRTHTHAHTHIRIHTRPRAKHRRVQGENTITNKKEGKHENYHRMREAWGEGRERRRGNRRTATRTGR